MKKSAVIIGAGPAGLMAADRLAQAGLAVTIVDAKPTFGRKFLMAGKSGLNLTKDEPIDQFIAHYDTEKLAPMLTEFGPAQVMEWANSLGGDVFSGSSRRVFPRAMKASPLLRAWTLRLDGLGVDRRVNWRLTGIDGLSLTFDTPIGAQTLTTDVAVLALGGASWARLGSDGAWPALIPDVSITPFAASNVAYDVNWSDHMAKFFGSPLKSIKMTVGNAISRGEIIVSAQGIEGGGIYPLAPALRAGGALIIDLLPDWTIEKITTALMKQRGKNSLSNHLRKALNLDPLKLALLREFGGALPDDIQIIAQRIKALQVSGLTPRPIDQAISTSGGIKWNDLDDGLMIKSHQGLFCAGEMVDWDAPTGGYLITACLAMGHWAGQHAARWVNRGASE